MPINLLYHDVTQVNACDSSGFPGPCAARYKLSDVEFAEDLDRLAEVVAGFPLATANGKLLRDARESDWLITFDDGGLSAATVIAEELERRGWRGWFFIATDYIGQPAFCGRDQIADLCRRGHVIGSHSCSHPERISDCSREQLMVEWQRSREILEDITSGPIVAASVPGGFYTSLVAETAIASGLNVIFNSEPTTFVERLDHAVVLGRYNIYRGMTAAEAAALVSNPMSRWKQTVFWSAKKVAKNVAGPLYKSIRECAFKFVYSNS